MAPESSDDPDSRPRSEDAGKGFSVEHFATAVSLMKASPRHQRLFLFDLDWLLIPPLRLGQYTIARSQEGKPVAFISWANVSGALHDVLSARGRDTRLKDQDWSSGDVTWIVDVVAPLGGVEALLADFKRSRFPDQDVFVTEKIVSEGTSPFRKL